MKQLQNMASVSLKYFFDIEEQVIYSWVQLGKFYVLYLALNITQQSWITQLGHLKKLLR